MVKQLNFYRSKELMAELEAEAMEATKMSGREVTQQDMLRFAWKQRPGNLRRAKSKATGLRVGAKLGRKARPVT